MTRTRTLALPGHDRLVWVVSSVVIVAATVYWLVRAGTSSLFTDEALSWLEARSGLHSLLSIVRREEINPLGYPLLLHGWLKVSPSSSEFWLRLPSVVAGALLLGALAWLVAIVATRRWAVVVALVLGALSPFVFDYVEQVRTYIFVMLAVTVAVAALLQAERTEGSRGRWLALSMVAAVVAQAMHYTAWLVLVPVGVYLLIWSPLARRQQIAWTAVAAVSGVVWAPLLVEQMSSGHNAWLTHFADLGPGHFGDVFGGPFSGRIFLPSERAVLGALPVLLATIVCALRPRREPRLMVVLALAAPVALLLVTLAGHPALLIRYVAVAVPFMIVIMAVALTEVPLWSRVVLLPVLVLAIVNLVAADVKSGQYRDYRDALGYVRHHLAARDLVVGIGNKLMVFDLRYYDPRLLPHRHVVVFTPHGPSSQQLLLQPEVARAVRERRRVWVINTNFPGFHVPRPSGYRTPARHIYLAVGVMELVELSPGDRSSATAVSSSSGPA